MIVPYFKCYQFYVSFFLLYYFIRSQSNISIFLYKQKQKLLYNKQTLLSIQQMDLVSYQKLNLISKQTYEDILTKRIGNGQAQQKLTFGLYFLMFSEGCQSIAISLILPSLQRQFIMSTQEKYMLLLMILVGMTVGHVVQSFSDSIGRLLILKWNVIIHLLFGLLSCFSPSIMYFIIFRFLHSIALGISLPLSATYIAEISPAGHRAMSIAISRIAWGLGFMFTLFFGWWLLYEDRWRTLLFIICLPAFISLHDLYKNGRQSLRYLWVTQQKQQTYQLIKFMCEQNTRQPLTKQQVQYSMSLKQQINFSQQNSYSVIFSQKYRSMTLNLIIAWFCSTFLYNGTLVLMPLILVKKNTPITYDSGYLTMIMVVSFQISIYLYIQRILENEYLGRRKTLIYTFGIMSICSLALIVIDRSNATLLVIIFVSMRIVLAINLLAILPFVTELYSTLLRGRSSCILYVIGRFGIFLLAVMGSAPMEWWDGNGFYIIIAVLSIISVLSVYKIQHQTYSKPLDFF